MGIPHRWHCGCRRPSVLGAARVSTLALGELNLRRLDVAGVVSAPALNSVGAYEPVAIVSVNMDHIYKFGFEDFLAGSGVRPVYVADGSPVCVVASALARTRWPRAAGADYVPPIAKLCATTDVRLGVFGSQPLVHEALMRRWAIDFPWGPDSGLLFTRARGGPRFRLQRVVVRDVRASGVQVLMLALGKPKQERWIKTYGSSAPASVLLPIGAGVEFWVGAVRRAPSLFQRLGIEWVFRMIRNLAACGAATSLRER